MYNGDVIMTLNNTKSSAKEFSVHPALIYSLITKQASGAPKALLELVMNCVDAGSSRIDVTITPQGYTIADNGKGFKDKEEITAFFGTFGTPHAASDAYYGRFRLGRAQSFGISKTKWYSKDFCMSVDLKVELNQDDKEVPLGYEVTTGHPFYDGCKIVGEFYEEQNVGKTSDFYQLSYSERPENLALIPALMKMIRYLPVDVYINGEKANVAIDANVPYSKSKNALYFLIEDSFHRNANESVVNVYNKGVYAYQIHSYYFGGDIVATDTIDLNIARNEAKFTCPINKEINRKLKALEKKIELASYGDDEDEETYKVIVKSQEAFVEDVWETMLGLKPLNVEAFQEVLKKRAIVLANDSKVSFYNIYKAIKDNLELIDKKEMPFYLYEDANKIAGDLNKDFLSISKGVFPRTFFPSDALIDKLCFKVVAHRQLFLERILRDVDFNKKFEITFEKEDTKALKMQKLIQAMMNSVFTVMEYHPEDKRYNDGWYTYYYHDASSIGKNPLKNINELMESDSKEFARFKSNLRKSAKLNEFEKMILSALQKATHELLCYRTLSVECIQEKGVLGFTNGGSYIVFTEEYFKKSVMNGDFESLINTLIHEASHDSNSMQTHQHGAQFYSEFNKKFTKYFLKVCSKFYAHIGLRLEKRINTKGADSLKSLNISDVALKRIVAKRLGDKVRAFA